MNRRICISGCLWFLMMLAPAGAEGLETFLEQVLAEAEEVTAAVYPDADAVVVRSSHWVTYEADGTSVSRDRQAVKILTEKGKRRLRSWKLYFTLPYSTVGVERLLVVKPDGTRQAVDTAMHSRVMVDRSQMDKNIFNPNQKILEVGAPGLEIGDVLVLETTRDTVKARIPDTWSEVWLLEYDLPIQWAQIEVRGPAARPLIRREVRDEIAGTVTSETWQEGATNVYRWTIQDVPRMFPEPNMPPLYSVVQRLLVSTIRDWETISRWYWELSEPRLEAVTPGMRETVSNLVSGVEDRQTKVERLFRFVSQEIRYMGLTTEEEAPGYEPHDVSMTFENRYGVCRDKAALLVAMLRLADLEGYPVLIHNGPLKDPEVPQPFFNHAVVAVAEPGGGYQLMDPTDENTKDLMPAYLAHQSFLVAHPEGEGLRVSAVPSAEDHLVRIQSEAVVDAQGGMELSSTIRFEGVNDGVYRGFFAQRKPEERRRFFETVVDRRIGGARLDSFTLSPADIRDTSQPLVVHLTCRAEAYRVDGDTLSFLNPPWLGTSLGYANFVIGRTGLPERKYPLVTDLTCGVQETLRLRLEEPPDALPESESVASEALLFERSWSTSETGVLTGTSRFEVRTVEFSPREYLELKQALQDVEVANRGHLTWTGGTGGPSADSILLDVSRHTKLESAGHWSSRVRSEREILTYAGAKRYAEVSLGYVPVWETVVVHRAVVVQTNGQEQALATEERNVMDAGWVGGAPRYPAERTLVLSLPNVQVGSRIVLDVERRVMGKPFYADAVSFRGRDPIVRQEVRLEAPLEVPVRTWFPDRDVLVTSVETQDATRVWQVAAPGPMAALPSEEQEPPRWFFVPSVLFSAGDWTNYAGQLMAALEERSRPTPAMEAVVEGLLGEGGADAAETQWRRLRDAVARRIRPAGPSFETLPLASLTSAEQTWAEGYGHQADRAILLAALLRSAGFEASLVPVAAGGWRVEELMDPMRAAPQRGLLGRVLVELTPPAGGHPIYLGDTDQYDVLGSTASEGLWRLHEDGQWTRIEAAPDREEQVEEHLRITLREDGSARVVQEVMTYGRAFGKAHRLNEELTPEERRRRHRELLAELSQSAEPVGPLVTDFEGYPGRRLLEAEVPRLATLLEGGLSLEIPTGWVRAVGLQGEAREHPWYRSAPLRFTQRIELELPGPAWSVALAPDGWRWEQVGAPGEVRARVFEEPGRLILEREVDLEAAVVPAANVPSLRELQRRLRHPAAGRVILVRGEGVQEALVHSEQ